MRKWWGPNTWIVIATCAVMLAYGWTGEYTGAAILMAVLFWYVVEGGRK